MYNINLKIFVVAEFNFTFSRSTCVRCEHNNSQNNLVSVVYAGNIFMAMLLLCKRQLKGAKVVETHKTA
jgi:hypothetical protein